MAPTRPSTTAARRKSPRTMKIILKLSPQLLKRFESVERATEDNSPSSSAVENATVSSSTSETIPKASANTLMPPPSEAPKKKGVKRSSAAASGYDGSLSKSRGRPGPKKKARLDDGTLDHSTPTPRAANGSTTKLGPKANQGAINAGLRALDRSGKPCRKWSKGSFKLKSFTGVCWEIPRWKAPVKVTKVVEIAPSGNSTSVDMCKKAKGSGITDSGQSDKSNTAVDLELGSTNSHPISSPAPQNLSAGENMDASVQSSPVAVSV